MSISYPPFLKFTYENTPIVAVKKCAERYPDYRLWIKRDDLTGMELSGNKVRKLDFLLKDALIQGATHVITCGGVQSNHCRATAFMAAKLGLKCTLFLRGEPENIPTGNFFLNKLLNSQIKFVSPNDYRNIDSIMSAEVQDLSDTNKKAYIIPEGGSNALGAWGYIRCFQEIVTQIEEEALPIQSILVATGSGGTHAGLLLGKKLLNSGIEILSVNVCDDAAFFKRKIYHIMEKFKSVFEYQFPHRDEDITIHDGFVGKGYGKITITEIDMIKRMANTDGIVLDPVYGAKAFIGLEDLLMKKELPFKNILFIHTGGLFGIFPFANDFYKY
jgi:D-cysteine desulfhydrase